MRNIKYITIVLLFAFLQSNGQEMRKSKYLSINKYEHDFGIINQLDGDVNYKFLVKNTSTKNLLMTNVVPECSCTEPIWTTTDIAPGASGEILVGYKASHYPGEFEKKIQVFTTSDTFDIKIIGKVIPKPLSDVEKEFPFSVGKLRFPENFIGLNTIYDNDVKNVEIVFYNDSSKAIYKQKMSNIPSYMRVKFPDTIAPKSVQKLLISFNPKVYADYGHTVDYLSLTVGKETKEFSVTGNVTPYIPDYTPNQLAQAPRIYVSEDNSLDMGSITKESNHTFKLNIQNSGKSNLSLLKIKPACTCIVSSLKEKIEILPGQSQEITFTFDTKGREGKTKKNIYIYSNDPLTPAYVFKLMANVE